MNDPLVTVGMFVRNGERTIAQAIESFLSQTMDRLVINVHDNASTDRTAEIVHAIARRDARVRLMRKPANLGAIRNCIDAASHVRTPLFCWAACDDLRQPDFLSRLAGLLERQPRAGLAACAVRNIDPDGRLRDVRRETDSLTATTGMTSAQRVMAYLRRMPGTPFYGLFRADALPAIRAHLLQLEQADHDGRPLLGVDMIVLARVFRDFDFAWDPEPLLHFRRGGMSHDLGRFGSIGQYAAQLRRFNRELRLACASPEHRMAERLQLAWHRRAAVARWLLSGEMRRMSAHYLQHSIPLARFAAMITSMHANPAMRRLRVRVRRSAPGSRIVLFGAGKHTRARIDALRLAVGRHGDIVGACDDHAAACQPINGLPIVEPSQIAELRPTILLVSSDAYEDALHERALSVAPPGVAVWRLYDHSAATGSQLIESDASSTASMNLPSSESASPSIAA